MLLPELYTIQKNNECVEYTMGLTSFLYFSSLLYQKNRRNSIDKVNKSRLYFAHFSKYCLNHIVQIDELFDIFNIILYFLPSSISKEKPPKGGVPY